MPAPHHVRITGGVWRSRQVRVTQAPGLRPTPDRVRQTLFNWLGQDLSNLACLDLFAGSGILGLEAASRGAACVDFVELQAHVLTTLRKNTATFADSRLNVIEMDALKFADRPPRRYDLVFLDPPYSLNILSRIGLYLPNLASPGMRVYAEAAAPIDRLGKWLTVKHAHAGQVHFHVLKNPDA